MNQLPISALVVSHNEGYLLEDCLKSIQFCQEIFVIDLQSNDNTIEIANRFKCVIREAKKVDMVEMLFQEYISQLTHEWIMLIDPDERIDPFLANDIEIYFKNIPTDCGRINVPIQYYYKNIPLKGTIWGGDKSGRLLVKRSAINISNNVHNAVNLNHGYLTYRIKRKGNNVDHHFWVQNYDQMLEKHKRYISREGKAKYEMGERFSVLKVIKVTIKSFTLSYFKYKGYKDGFLGVFLSLFYAWYNYKSWTSLKKYQIRLVNGKA